MATVGPVRIILIRAGKYEYAEVDLTRPLHLIGPNNVGKTTLVNTLQYLYIDNRRYMDFAGKAMAETLRYYFPDRYSYVLFECLTPTGFRVLGIRGLGPTNQFNYERFAYQGRYEPEDYFTHRDGRSYEQRSYEEVNLRLGLREYTVLEPVHLRAALTGGTRNNGVDLGLLPLKNRGDYERFRLVFSNLLRLSHLRQDELKQLLCDVYESDFRQTAIRLDSTFGSHFNRVRRLEHELQELERLAPTVRQALKLAGERDDLRKRLPGLWRTLYEHYEAEQASTREQLAKTREQAASQADVLESLESDRTQATERRREVDRRLGTLEAWITEHEAYAAEFRNFSERLAEEARANVEDRLAHISRRLAGVTERKPAQIEKQLARVQRQRSALEQRLGGIRSSLAACLSSHLDREELLTLFQVVNPDLAGASEEAGHLSIDDLDALLREARQLLKRVREGVLMGPWGHLALSAAAATDPDEYLDADRIAEEIQIAGRELERLRDDLDAARRTSELRAEANALRRQRDGHIDTLSRYRRHAEQREKAEAWLDERKTLHAEAQMLAERDDELLRQLTAVRDERRRLTDEVGRLERLVRDRDERMRDLPHIPEAWLETDHHDEGSTEGHNQPQKFEALAHTYGTAYRRCERLHHELTQALEQITSWAYERFGTQEEEMLARMEQELDGLASKRDAVQRAWDGLVSGLSRAFKDLLADLDHLRTRIHALNRVLTDASVSDLQRLRLLLDERPRPTGALRRIVESDASPLFSEPQRRQEALERIGEFLSQHPVLHLKDLFNLRFEVTGADGSVQTYAHLDKIESNGTSITIKVLTNLVLLSDLFHPRKERALPFYLDEASSLDAQNLRAIVVQAQSMGFVPVLASPDPAEAADLLYFPQEMDGRVYIQPDQHSVRIARSVENDDKDATAQDAAAV